MLRTFSFLTLLTILSSNVFAYEQPNVIYILADDLGYGDLSCYGQTRFKTPHIDRLASEGLKCTGHYSGNTVCSPSRASILTGKYTPRHGITDWIGAASGEEWRKVGRHTRCLHMQRREGGGAWSSPRQQRLGFWV